MMPREVISMGTFLFHFAQLGTVLLCLATPVFWVAWKQGRRDLTRRFLVTAFSIAVLFGVVGWKSEILVNHCIKADNTQCFDSGYQGFQLLVGGS